MWFQLRNFAIYHNNIANVTKYGNRPLSCPQSHLIIICPSDKTLFIALEICICIGGKQKKIYNLKNENKLENK